MHHSRSSSAASKSSSGAESSGKGSSTTNNSGNSSVFSKVLGIFCHFQRDGNGTANKEEDLSWANNHTTKHHSNHARHDKRLGLRQRNSQYVLDQLSKIWKHRDNKADIKKRERTIKGVKKGFTGGMGHPTRQNQDNRDYERRHVESEIEFHDGKPGRLQDEQVPNFSRKETSPVSTENRWETKGNEEQSRQYNFRSWPVSEIMRKEDSRPSSSPSTMSAASDSLTIRVGLEIDGARLHAEVEPSGLKMRPGIVETGGRNYNFENEVESGFLPSAPPPAPGSFGMTPAPEIPQYTPLLPSTGQEEAARNREPRPLSRGLQQLLPATVYQALTEKERRFRMNSFQTSSARVEALRMAMTPLQIDRDRERTPALVAISSPATEQASPVTPTDERTNRAVLALELPPHKTCPMPSCDSRLLTATDQKHNLCAHCRDNLQPRQSVFRTNVLNPVLPTRMPLTEYTKVAEATLETLPATRYDNSAHGAKTTTLGDGDRPVYNIRAKEWQPSLVPTQSGPVSSRFNKDKSEFRLQPAPVSRKKTRRMTKSPISGPSAYTSAFTASSPPRGGSDHAPSISNSHIGFQLAGWEMVVPMSSPTYQGRPSLRRVPSGPLLEPKTFCPPTPTTKRQKKDIQAIKRKLSGSRRQARGATVRRALSSSKQHVEKRGDHQCDEPLPTPIIAISPRSPGRRRVRLPSRQHRHSEHHAVARSHSKKTTIKGPLLPLSGARGVAMLTDEDIYREINNIIDCYLRVPGAPDWENKERKAEVIASYFAEVPLDVEMKIKGFI